MELYAELRGLEKSQHKTRFDELLKFTGLELFTRRISGRLSGGMKQKLGLACSLIKKPKLLLLDEPSVGVDPISRRELWRMIRELINDDVVVIWNTAYLDEAELCDDVLLLNNGQLLFHGQPNELTKKMEGRVVQIVGLSPSKRRKTLMKVIKDSETLDGTIQGNAIRVVLKSDAKEHRLNVQKLLDDSESIEIIPTPPRFEDGFMDILGGASKVESVFAQRKFNLTNDDSPVVIARNLTKRFGNFIAVYNNNFEIKRGEIFGLLGPNGAGKSTTFKMLCGLLKPTEGEGFIAGYNLRKSPSRARSRLGYMAQKFSMYGELTAKQNLNFFAGVYGLWGFEKRKAIETMLEIFDLTQYSSVNASLLPLGFKQRLSLAAALMHKPDVLFLDEPTSGVDPLTRREFWSHINTLVENGVTALVTTHFMDEAEYCDRIALIYRGETIATGAPDDLKQSVKNEKQTNPTLEDAFITLIEKMENNKM
jgi:ABC-2 type transport system ATP-binding protein